MTRLTAVICEDEPRMAAALADTVTSMYGLHLAATVDSVGEAIAATHRETPSLVVVDLALAGELGLGVIAALHEAAPGCAVVVLVPPAFVGLQFEAVASGAMNLVETTDLRPLQCCIEHLTEVHGEGCPSCADQARRRAALWDWRD